MPVRPAPLRRRVLSAVAVAAVTLASLGGSEPVVQPVPAAPAVGVAERYYPEVRLRKMHLVRPDLIPFPIDFDVYC